MSDQVGRNAFDVPNSSESESTGEKPRDWRRIIMKWLPLIVFGGIILAQAVIGWGAANQVPTVEYSVFKARVATGEITRVEIGADNLVGLGRRSGAAEMVPLYQSVPVDDPSFVDLLDEHNVEYYAVVKRSTGWLTSILGWLLPLGLIFYFWRRMSRKGGVMGSDILSIGKSRSRIVAEGETGVTFDDVAGADEAKAELEEIVDFLKSPDRYSEIGGRIPKGILLVGAPGTVIVDSVSQPGEVIGFADGTGKVRYEPVNDEERERLLDKYDVSYIYIGEMEHKTYDISPTLMEEYEAVYRQGNTTILTR